ncbi:hypothetical protein C1645_830154 [Glomus cerebriforme]|uniref:Protein kinase domain-containing protein n=1 Tax=Glomus cerebriforme TaxID=658196 RepID=A0A397SPA9_9GLOM|nr:hypothetical protein C1645_830154 [Glomus cerebriforme]
MPAASYYMQMKSSVQRPKKINPNSLTPLITEKELLTAIPSSISYSTQSYYDFFNHGKSRSPRKVFHWENFIEMVKNHKIDNVIKKYEKPSVPLGHAPITTKEELIQVIDVQIVRPLTSKLNHVDLELCKPTESSLINLINWNVINDYNQIIASLASRTHRVLRTKNEDDVIDAYQQNTGDFADNINEVYDYMCELGLKYSVLTTYEFTWFLKRSDDDPSILLISKCQKIDTIDPTILQSWNYLLYLSKNEPLLTPYPTIIPSNNNINNNLQNNEYFLEYSYENYPYISSSIENFTSSSTGKRPISNDDENFEIKKFRHNYQHHHDNTFSEDLSSPSSSNYFTSYGIMNWDNIIIKNEIGINFYLAEYNGEQLSLKYTDPSDQRKFDLEKESRIYKRLSSIQGVYIPRVKYNDFTLKGEKYVLATEHIKQTSTLSKNHKEEALKAVKAIHSLGIIHNDIRESNFIVGRNNDNDNANDERVFIIDFRLSKDFKEEQRVQLTSYHIYMEKEKEKVEELFNQLPN